MEIVENDLAQLEQRLLKTIRSEMIIKVREEVERSIVVKLGSED